MKNRLTRPDAWRVLNARMLERLAIDIDPTVSRATRARAVADLVAAGDLGFVQNGLYLNLRHPVSVLVDEAAGWLRSGAIVSLQKVLGDSGVLNNYTPIVFAVVPIPAEGHPPKLGRVDTEAGIFQFRGIPEAVLTAPRREDLLVQNIPYARATPEAALCHWVYLGMSPRSDLGMPQRELDLERLSMARLSRIARAMRIESQVEVSLGRARENSMYDEGVKVSAPRSPTM